MYLLLALVSFGLINFLLWYSSGLFGILREKVDAAISHDEDEIRAVLQVMDGLLEKLPEKEIERFMKTKDADLYKSVMKKYGVE
jgi:hypothetical protein